MHDLGTVWAAVPRAEAARIDTDGGSIRQLGRTPQVIASGNIRAAAGRAGVDPTGVGALGSATGEAYSVRIARDRLLIVAAGGMALDAGWHEGGYAVTDMTALDLFEIEGALGDEIVARATTLPVSGTGPSAAVVFAGVGAYLYRHGDGSAVRVHIDPSHTAYVWEWLDTAVAAMRG